MWRNVAERMAAVTAVLLLTFVTLPNVTPWGMDTNATSVALGQDWWCEFYTEKLTVIANEGVRG